MTNRITLELAIGHTYGTENTYYSGKHVKKLLAGLGLPCTILFGEGTEDGSEPFEDTSVIVLKWNETTHCPVEVFCSRLSEFLGRVALRMSQRWVLLDGFAFNGNAAYPIYIELNLENRRSLQPEDFFSQQQVVPALTPPHALLRRQGFLNHHGTVGQAPAAAHEL
jgi:hypothetical protein